MGNLERLSGLAARGVERARDGRTGVGGMGRGARFENEAKSCGIGGQAGVRDRRSRGDRSIIGHFGRAIAIETCRCIGFSDPAICTG